MVEVQSLSKKFGEHWALKNTTWKINDKRSLGLLGPNGAGKSTTMKIMTGLLCSSEGKVLIDGEDIMTDPIAVKRKIGYLPETPPLYEELSVYDFFDFVCGLKSVPPGQRSSHIDNSIEKLNLQEVAFKPIRVLSKGFRQRVGIGQSLIGNPSILILDEPSVGLDPHQVYELREVIKSLKSEHTVILSTHILSEVQQICDDVVILDKGEVKSQGAISELLEAPEARQVLQVKLSNLTPEIFNAIKQISEVEMVEELKGLLELSLSDKTKDFNKVIQAIIEKGGQIQSILPKQQKLEDVFIEVTQ